MKSLRFKNIKELPLDHPMWEIRQSLIDMASNLDSGYVNGQAARNSEIDCVENAIENLISYEDHKITAAISFATERIEGLCDLLIEAPIEDFREFFEAHDHWAKEVGYDLGLIQGYMEALGIPGEPLGEKLDEIIDMMHDVFDRA